MKTPDRFEKMVERERLAATYGLTQTKILRADDTVRLLRRQYAALRRLVVKQTRWEHRFDSLTTQPHGTYLDRQGLLDAMDHWKRGTK